MARPSLATRIVAVLHTSPLQRNPHMSCILFACTSRWSPLEVGRALKKDGKPRELVELNLRELRRHEVSFIDVTRTVLSDAERLLMLHDLYASDALHVATFTLAARSRQLDAMLTDDLHIQRLGGIVRVLNLNETSAKLSDLSSD